MQALQWGSCLKLLFSGQSLLFNFYLSNLSIPILYTYAKLPYLFLFFFPFWLHLGHSIQDLSSPRGIEPIPLAVEAWSLDHQIDKEVLKLPYLQISPSLVAQMAKNLPVMQETQVPSLGGGDSLQKGMATHSSILALRIREQRSLEGYSLWGHK